MKGKYELRPRERSIESRARKPVKGLRLRLRTELRRLGVKGKFRTDLLRDGRLVVRGIPSGPINKFDGRDVVYCDPDFRNGTISAE